ncbi:putative beta-ig-h3 fasciclin [Purpureocillium lavendulum]|uniref:Beta-ig-h3 fasciclin n=1 Tax=Purpureocillium lavendulum TaxID=1247861 RepID=A0AB34FFJ2_9HYPO|nr:putative beta-ig-h3 fasciclin [Purpureocillium lavendulum]
MHIVHFLSLLLATPVLGAQYCFLFWCWDDGNGSNAPTPTVQTDLLKTLKKNPNLTAFANLLAQYPAFLRSLSNSTNYTIFAPTNAALKASKTSSKLKSRSEKEDLTPGLALLFVDRGESPPALDARAAVLRTKLTDTKYVNLGRDVSANIISEPDLGSGRQNVTLTSGLGKTASIFLSNIDYKHGVIQEASSVLTPPQPLDRTLQETNGTNFLNALIKEQLLDTVANSSRITVFVPVDSAFRGKQVDSSVLQQHILEDFLGYTPALAPDQKHATKGGTSVTISYKQDTCYVNNAKIVRANVITKNGVIHYIDDVHPHTLLIAIALAALGAV